MTKKQFYSAILILILPVVLAGCFKKEVPISKSDDGSYIYTAKDLGFGLTLPKEFEYFQTQRQNKGDYTDLEIFVPTSDTAYPQKVPGYANIITIRVSNDPKIEQPKVYELIGSDDTRSYYVLYWDKVPTDWTEKWTDSMKKKIIDSFKKVS